MRNKKPPFEITHKIIDYVAEIAELVDRLTVVSPLSTSLTLRHANCIKTILDLLSLSLEQVTAVLNRKHVLAPPKDIAEVKNTYEIYKQLDGLDPYSVSDLLTAHDIMIRGLVESPAYSAPVLWAWWREKVVFCIFAHFHRSLIWLWSR